jgi:hypothetical protein
VLLLSNLLVVLLLLLLELLLCSQPGFSATGDMTNTDSQ